MPVSLLPDDQLPPIPPADLIQRVVPAFDSNEVEQSRVAFNAYARASISSIERALASVGRDFTDFRHILDFGCGPGRLMRHLAPLAANAELYGVDVDADVIAWCEAHLPFATFSVGPHDPPTLYADATFDLILNHSVFTHLDEGRQDGWLRELRRILAPGGLALLTVHSTRQWNQAIHFIQGAGENASPYIRRMAETGFVYIVDDAFVGSTHPEWYHTTYHAPWYVYERWTEFFALRAYIHEGSDTQDMIVLERLSTQDAMLSPIRHSTDRSGPAGASALRESSRGERREEPATLAGKLGSLRVRVNRVHRRRARQRLRSRVADLERAIDSLYGHRSVSVLRTSLYQQGQRISVVERELRADIQGLQDRLEELSGG